MKQSLHPTPSILRGLVACLLAFTILIMPIAAVAAPSIARASLSTKTDRTDKTNKTDKAKSADEELFVNPPTALTAPALPGPKPEPAPEPLAPFLPGPVTATMTATIANDDADTKIDPTNGVPATTERIDYTAILTNTGSDPTGLMSFNDFIDPHTTLVAGSIKSTPVCFDQTGINAVSTNEDVAKAITLTGEDPDGDGITFSIVSGPSNGSLNPGVAGASQTYTPAANFFGADTFTFRVNDGTTSGAGANGNSNETCTVSITVNPVNDAPTFTVPGNPAAVNEDAGAQNVLFITPASIRPAQSGNTTEDAQTVSFVITNNTNPGLFSSAPAINVNAGAYPRTANLTFTPAANQNGTATITYHAHDDGGTANSGVDNSADQTFTITVNAVNDPPVVVGPGAFAVQANMKRTGLTGLLGNVNDNADNGVNGCVSTTFTVTNVSATTPAGGTISNLNTSTGTFDFDPPPGVTGAVTFTYTVTDTGCPVPGVASAPVTVTFNVAGPVIWFVNPAAGPETGAGTLNSPFKLLSSANAKLASFGVNQKVFIYTGLTTIGVLEVLDLKSDNDWLVGQGTVAASFDAIFGLTGGSAPPAGTIARPTISSVASTANGMRPTVRGTVTMRNNTQVMGLNIDVTGAAAGSKGIGGIFTAGTSAVADVNVTSGTGNAVDFSGAQTVTYTTSDGTNSPNVLVSGTGSALSVVNTTIGGSGLNFKSITSTGGGFAGIVLNNTGTLGSLTVNGTGTTAGSGGTISGKTTNGVSLTNAKNTVLKNMNLTSNASTNGTTSTNCGVTAASGANASCTAGVNLNTVNGVTLDNVDINGSGQNGINGLNVIDLKIQNGSQVRNCGNESGENGVYIQNLSGLNNLLSNSTFQNNHVEQFSFVNWVAGTLGTLASPFNVTGCTFTGKGNTTTPGGDGFFGNIRSTGTGYISIGGGANAPSNFRSNYSYGAQVLMNDAASATFIVNACAFGTLGTTSTYNNSGVSGGISQGSTLNYTFSNNTIYGSAFGTTDNGTPILLTTGTLANGATLNGSITGNTIGSAGTVNSGCNGNCNGITILMNGNGVGTNTCTSTITSNNIQQVGASGIQYIGGDQNKTVGSLHIRSNTIANPNFPAACSGTSACGQAITLSAETSAGALNPNNSTLCADIGNGGANAIFGSWNVFSIRVQALRTSVFKIGGWNGAPANNPTAFIAGNNGLAAVLVGSSIGGANQGSFTGDTTVCTPLFVGAGGVPAAFDWKSAASPFDLSSLSFVETATGKIDTRLPSLSSSATSSNPIMPALDQRELDSIVEAAIQRWAATGLSRKQIATLRSVKFEVSDLDGAYLGEAKADRILVDRDAEGRGWFVDSNPLSDASFNNAVSATRFYTEPTNPAAGRVDLLTAIEHELGHKLGLEDLYAATDRDNLMYGYLTVGERRLPATGQVANATPGQYAGAHFLSFLPSDEKPIAVTTAPDRVTIKANSVYAGASASLSGAPITKSDRVRSPRVSKAVEKEVRAQRSEVRDQKSDVRLNHARRAAKANSTTARVLAPMPFAGGTFPINGTGAGFILPAGKSTTITFRVTLNNPPNLSGVPPATPQVSNFGTLSGAFSNNPVNTNTVATNVDLFNTATVVTASPSGASSTNQPVTFTATVSFTGVGSPAPLSGTPAGTMVFKDGVSVISGCGAAAVVSGQAQCVTSTLGNGPHTITAEYSGDGSYDPSTSGGFSQTVSASNTTTAIATSGSPSFHTQNVTFTATVTSSTSVVPPTGTVQFRDGATLVGTALGAPVPLTSGGACPVNKGCASLTINTLTAGPHTITADFLGDSAFNASTGSVSQQVDKSNTATSLISAPNPSTPGQNVTFTATVTSATSVSPPTGTVDFKDGATVICDDVAKLAGQWTCQTTTLTNGSHSITAVYNEDATWNTSTSNTVTQDVNQLATTTALVSSLNPAAPTVTVTFTATVSTASGTPTGTVTFLNGASPLVCDNGATSVQPLTGFIATCDTNDLPEIGSPHSITAHYDGDTTYAASTSNIVSQVITSCSASVVVTTIANSGAGSLRQAIDTGVCTGGTITFDTAGVFATPQTITLTTGELSIARNLTIDGPDAAGNRVTVSGGGIRVFRLGPGFTATIRDINITGGGNGGGAGILNDHGTLTVLNVTLSGNTATPLGGGAIYNDGSTSGSATLNVINSTISSNTAATGPGGGIYNNGLGGSATANVVNSTISGNSADNGGGICNESNATGSATLRISNSTFSGNSGAVSGGALLNLGSDPSAVIQIANTILKSGTGANIVNTPTSTFTSLGFNLSDDAAGGDGTTGPGGLLSATGDQRNTNPLLGALASNGGPTQTHALLLNSPALDKGNFAQTTLNGGIDNVTTSVTVTDASTIPGGVGFTIRVDTEQMVVVSKALNVLTVTRGANGTTAASHSTGANVGPAFDQRGFARTVNFDSIAPIAPYDDTDIGAYEQQVTPGTPNAPDLDAASDTGVSSTDNLTSDTSPTFTITGVTPGAFVELLRDVSPGTGTQQVETATVVGAIPGSNQVETLTVTTPGDLPLTLGGDASVTVTAVGMTNSPKTILVAVAALDDAAAVAGKIRAALTADADIGHVATGFFTISGTLADVVLTAKVKAANDGTMNSSVDSCTCTGLTAVPSSANTTPGAASGAGNATVTVTAAGMNNSPKTLNVAVGDGDTASIVAGKMRTALSADPDVSAFFTVSGTLAQIVLTAKTAAVDDVTLNIATANGTATGLTPAPTSGNTTAGAAGPIVVASGIAAGTSIQLTDPSVAASATPYLYTARQTVSGAPRSPQSASLSVTIDNTTPAAPDAPDLIAASDTGSSSTDNLTNDTTPTFDIGNVTSGNTVNLLRDTDPTSGPPVVVATGVAAGSSIQLTDPSAPAGSYSYTSRQTNGIGNSTSSTTALIVNIDTTPPPAPGTPDLQAGSDSFAGGGTNSDNITNAAALSFDVAGTTVGATVQLLRDGAVVASTAGTGGTVVLTDSPSPSDNVYAYTARQVDTAGNFATSAALNVTIDKIGTAAGIPDLRATSDSFGPSGTNSDDITNVVARSFDIPTTESGSLVELYRGATLIASTTGTGGTVTLVDNSLLADGPYAYTSRQTDIVGNVAASTELFVTIDMTPNAPGVPDLQAASDTGTLDTDNITGNATHSFDISAQIGAFVELLRDGVVVASTTATLASVTLSDSASLPDALYHYSARQTDKAGNIATSADLDVTIDGTKPSVAMTSGVGNPTATTPIPVTVTFSEAVSDFTLSDIVPGNGTVGNLLGGPAIYTFDLTPTSPGAVSADIAAGVATDTAGNTNTAATQFNRTFDPSALSVSITAVSPDPRNTSVSSIQIVFNKPVTGFDLADLSLTLNAGPNLLTGAQTLTSGDNMTWTLGNLGGLTGAEGTYLLTLTAPGGIIDAATNPLTSGATETWVVDTTAPTVTVSLAVGQVDPVTGPTASTVINFKVVFSESVADFINTDVNLSGAAGATVANVSGSGTTYNVAVEGMTSSGAVTITIAIGAATDAAGNGNSNSGTATVTFFKDDFATLEVNTTDDSDDGACTPLGGGGADCTLREAILAANADAGAETITFNSVVFAAPGPYTINLGSALPDLTTSMTINGPGANVLTVRRNVAGNFRIFMARGGATVNISGLTMNNGRELDGGGMRVGFNAGDTATVTLTRVAVTGNTAIDAGGGGGLLVATSSTLNLIESTVSGNQTTFVPAPGGGIFNNDGVLTVTNSTISGNSTTNGNGGGIFAIDPITISNSTITNNTAGGGGGGGGVGLSVAGTTATIRNTIIAGNNAAGGPDVFNNAPASFSSEGYNLIQSTSGATINETLNPGTNITGVDPQLFPLADNGGPTFTHALQCTSPAIDKGKAFTLTTDQRGGVRPFDLADAIYPNAAGGDGSDIGAYETQTGGGCQPVAVPPAPQPSTNEDTPVVITLTGTYSQNFALTFAITQSPAHGSLGSISAPNCVFTLSMTCTSTVTYTPSANSNGLDSFKFKTSASGLDSDDADVNITVVSVNDAPVASGDLLSNIAEDSGVRTIPFADLTASDSPGPANEAGQALTVISVSNPVGGTVSILATDVLFTPTANYHGPASFQYKIRDNGTTNGLPDPKDSVLATTASFTIDPVADTPSVTNATTDEDTQTTSGLVISRNPADGNEVTHFKITGITNGTLFQNDGTTPIANNQFITFAEGNAGLRFTPDANLFSPTSTFSFQVQSSLSNTDLGLGGSTATATITVNPVADTPSVTSATTDVNIQTTSGLVISRNAADSTEVSHFKITNITNGTLFKNDGTTQINNGGFVTFAEGNAGLRFTPANNLSSPASTFSFDVQGATSAVGAGLGTAATATITVNCGPTVVTNSNDSGAGSLRAIILSACPDSTITFDMTPGNVTSPINLSSQLVIDKSLTIQGPGANLLTIAGNNTFRLIDASTAGVNVSISGLSFTGGGVQGGAAASVIEFNNAGTLTLTNCEVFANAGAAAVSVVSAIQSTGVTVDGSTFRNNTANHSLKSDRTPLRVVNSTFSSNTGAAIFNASAGSTVTNSTIANNQTGIQSDSLLCSGCAASVTVTNTLFSSNGSLNLLLAGTGTITSGGHNLIDDSTAAAFSAPDASNLIIPAGTARIAPLANNGGPTQTHALLAGSPALDAGDNAAVANPPFSGAAPFNDQRGAGFPRIVDGPDADTTATVDIGAFESLLSVEDITDKTTNEDTQLQFVFNVGGAASITSVTATSANTTLVPNNAANIAVTGSGSTRTLTINPAANEFGTSLITVTVNGAGGQSMTDTFVLTVNSVNDVPSFIKGADQTVNEDAGAQSVAWATSISVGPLNEAGQTAAFLVTGNTNPGLFSAGPAISPTGTLTYTPATNINGSASITIVLKDNGGTANGGVDTSAPQTFTITVNSVNDAPSFTKGADQTVNEDAGAQTVNNWATTISAGPANESGQTVEFQVTGNTNPGLFSAGPAISPTGTLTYTPAANANGTAGLTIVLKDNGGTAFGGVDTSTAQNLVITVNPINDAPVNSVPGAQNGTLNATLVFSAANGNLISISDVDAGSDPVRVTLKATDGTLTLSTTSGLVFTVGDGTGDPLMTFTGSIANINAALNGMGNLTLGSGIIEITTNDQGRNGAGGALSDTDTIQVTVIDNLAPVVLTIPGTDRAIAFESPTFLIDPFFLVGNNNFTADHRTHIMIFALHAQLRPGETFSAITAEADVAGTVVPLIVESVNTVPNFDWLTQIVFKFPDGFSTGGGGPHDAKIRITLRGQNSNQAVIIVVPAPKP